MSLPTRTDLNRLMAFFMLLAYAGLIFRLSSGAVPDTVMFIGAPDFLLHMAEYAVLGFLVSRWVSLETGRTGWLVLVALPAMIASAYGTTDEVHQAFVSFRESSFSDIWADTVGGAMGAFAYAVLLWRFGRRAEPSAQRAR